MDKIKIDKNLKMNNNYKFAFLVHPRDNRDIFRKFPFLKYAPRWFLTLIERYLPPVIVSKITGLKGSDNKDIEGYIISIPMTAPRMLIERDRAVKQIRKAVKIARKKGVKMIGLGALTSSLTYGGKKLTDIQGISITTGHAYTGYNVTKYIFQIAEENNIVLDKITVGIVGAAGSIGGISAKILARAGVNKLILIDLQRKSDKVKELVDGLSGKVVMSTNLDDLKECHFIIAATNAPGALIKSSHVSPGTIIVDDAQPSDVADNVFVRDDVVVLEAGAVHTPGIKSNFKMGLHGDDINYCCMAELLLLSHVYHEGHYVTGFPTLEYVDEMQKLGDELGFKLAPYQNMYGIFNKKQMQSVCNTLRNRLGVGTI